MRKSISFAFFAAALFFLITFLTLKDYGPSWDEVLHFSRGQAYLNFYLTGKKEYPKDNPKRSFYQFDYHSGDFWFKDHGGHPPVSDILAASFNYIFYQKLAILSDIDSYHLFNILASSFMVFVVTLFSYLILGKFAAFISFLTLLTYPLFFAESHFNVKDPPEAAFFSATIFFFFLLLQGKVKWLVLSVIFFFLALGTKFNALFLPLIVLPYLFFLFKARPSNFRKLISKIPKNYRLVLIISPLIVGSLLLLTWPYLWNDVLRNSLNVFKFYKEIGSGFNYQPQEFYLFGFNLFPISWIIFTTPPTVLLLGLTGVISSIINKNRFNGVTILWLIWLLIPIFRVTLPGTSIYGGIRQVMEFLPALALLSGLGAWQIYEWSRRIKIQLLMGFTIVLLFLYPVAVLVKMHPNENVYFNSLIGGLYGAAKVNFPSWGNSYGNAYFQGINWINKNAEQNAKVSLIQGIEVNSPETFFRKDIKLNNEFWSGIERNGEYLMELNFNDTGRAFYYSWEYVDKFLDPVYELKVDGVPILKIWKNDVEHTKPEFRLKEERMEDFDLSTDKNILVIDLKKKVFLSRIYLKFEDKQKCMLIKIAFFETSLDGVIWIREKDWIPFPQVGDMDNLQGNQITFNFAFRKARFARLVFEDERSCALKNPTVSINILNPK